MGLVRSALLKAAESRWLAENLPRMAFSRRAVRRFMPGEKLDDALSECAVLAQRGIGSVITRLGENVASLQEADAVRVHYLAALNDVERRALPTHLSVKPTQLGLDISPDVAANHIAELAGQAGLLGGPLWIDMESSAYVDRTIELFGSTHNRGLNVGLCVQAYLHRTAQDLDTLLASSTAIRLVKGAYKESPSIAWQRKQDVDRSYLHCAERLLQAVTTPPRGYAPAFATHDPTIIHWVCRRADELGVPSTHYEFQMLYGIHQPEQDRLASAGYQLRVLISYGAAWFAWYMRRLAERPANLWFAARSAVG